MGGRPVPERDLDALSHATRLEQDALEALAIGDPTAVRASPRALDGALSSLLDRAHSTVELARRLQDQRARVGGGAVEQIDGAEHADRFVAELFAGARHEVVMCWPGRLPASHRVDALLGRQLDVLRRGVRSHQLHTPDVRTCPRTQTYLEQLHRSGARVRIVPTVPHELLMVDGRVATLPPTLDSDGTCQLVVRSPSLLNAVRAMVNQLWRRASDYPFELDDSVLRKDVGRRVLRCLAEGITDQVAARELGLSVRTYRRHVAAIMRELGASSRFQAGVLAAQRALL